MAASKPTAKQLSKQDWLQAGYLLVAEQGARALKIQNLCRQAGATRGSFYWHFADIGSYRAAMVEAWNELLEHDRRAYAEFEVLEPRERLLSMMAALVAPQHWILERAMREWARADPIAAANLLKADRRVLHAVTRAYRDSGFSAAEAELRAGATFAAGIGLLHLRGSAPRGRSARQREWFIDLMLSGSSLR